MSLILCLAFLCTAWAALYSKDCKVLQLNNFNFNDLVIKSNRAVFVKFYSPRCGHCHKMVPEWQRLANNLGTHVGIAAVNCEEAYDICGRYRVSGVPALKIFTRSDKDDKPVVLDYNGERAFDLMLAFATRHAISYVYRIDRQVKLPVHKRHVTLERFFSKGSGLPKVILFKTAKSPVALPFKTISSSFFGKILLGIVQLPGNEEIFEGLGASKSLDSLIFFNEGKMDSPLQYKGKIAFTPISQFIIERLGNKNFAEKPDL